MKDIKTLKQIAKQIYEYENLLQVKTDYKIENKIEELMMSLSLEDMFLIDEIIQNKNF